MTNKPCDRTYWHGPHTWESDGETVQCPGVEPTTDERREMEKSLEFGARYSPRVLNSEPHLYWSARRGGKSRLTELVKEAFPGGTTVGGAYVVTQPSTAGNHSGGGKFDWDDLVKAIKKAVEAVEPKTYVVHPCHAAQLEQYRELFTHVKAETIFSPACPEDKAYVYPTRLTTLPKEDTHE